MFVFNVYNVCFCEAFNGFDVIETGPNLCGTKTRRARNQHSMAFQTPIASTDVYKGSFLPQTVRDWNALPDCLISSAEDAEDCVAKFTSPVKARD